MPELTFLFTGVMAAGASAYSLRNIDPPTKLIISVWGMIMWGAFGFRASALTVVSGGTEFTYQLTPLFYIGVASALVMLLFAVQAASETFRTQTGATEEMI